jgi:hypothetical protein
MKRMAAVGLILMLAVLLVSVPAPNAQAGEFSGGISVEYWPAYVVATIGNFQFASWYAAMWGLQLRLRVPNTPLSWHLEYLGGVQSQQTGNWQNTSGRDKLVRTYFSYPFFMGDQFKLAGAMGWGKIGWDTDFGGGNREVFRSAGILFGLYAEWTIKHNLDLYAKATIQPMNTVTIANANTWTSTASMSDWQVGLRYTPSFGTITAGYRSVKAHTGNNLACPDCLFGWSGWFLKFGILLGQRTRVE